MSYISAKYFYYPGCRRRFILEYFNQVPKFFWCNYCDNCCEGKMIDLTNKFIEVIFNKGKYDKVFKPTELELLIKNDLIDDDQTLLLMSYLQKPELFELHRVSSDNWFVALKDYNENIS